MTDHEPPTIDAEPVRPLRRRPWAALGVLLVLVGIGLYVAWPAIEGGFNEPDFAPSPEKNAEKAAAAINAMNTGQVVVPPRDGAASPPTVPLTEAASSEAPVEVVATEPAEETGAASDPIEEAIPELDAPVAGDVTDEAGVAAAATAVETRLEALAARLEALEAMEVAERNGAGGAVAADAADAADSEGLAALEARLAALEASAEGDAGSADSTVMRRLDALEDSLEAQGDTEALAAFEAVAAAARADVATLASRVAGLEAALQARTREAGHMVTRSLAAGRLLVAASSGGSFAVELAALRERAAGDSELLAILDALQPLAQSRVPTAAALRSVFPAIAADVARAAGGAHDGGWVSETLAELKSIVTVRRIRGDLPPESVDARLLVAERALEAGDLAAAAGEVAAYRSVASPAVVSWLEDAEQRLVVDRLLARLEDVLVARAGAGQGAEAG